MPDSKRVGPRPLPLHLVTALSTSLSALACLPAARSGRLPWHPKLAAEAAELTEQLRGVPEQELAGAVALEAIARLQHLLQGIDRYLSHRAVRRTRMEPVLWQAGSTSLRDYGGPGRPVLFVPSLVNRADVLDLHRRCSLLQWLTGQGVRPLLVDWDAPGEAERDFDLGDYVTKRLVPALHCAAEVAGGPVPLVGYCMGGDLALALTLRCPDRIASLALLATPWDFHAGRDDHLRVLQALEPLLDGLLGTLGELPVDMLQALFAMLDPNLAQRKYLRFAELDPDSTDAEMFVALEDWINDGVPLTAGVARDCLLGWYGRNATARGEWRIDGDVVDPSAIRCPTLLAIPRDDRIVPPASARALQQYLPDACVLEPAAGHIGMVVGRQAEARLWRPLADWLRDGRCPS